MTPALESWIHPHLDVAPSAIDGLGLVAQEHIPAGTLVIVWGGRLLRQEDILRRHVKDHTLVAIDEDTFLGSLDSDAYTPDDYLNHSCEPTLWMRNALSLETRVDVSCGSELTADYAFWLHDSAYRMRKVCNCKSPLCRGTILGTDWLLPQLQHRYFGRFSPFINARIERLRRGI